MSRIQVNEYGAKCYICGVWVEASEGALERNVGGGWRVFHHPSCPEDDEDLLESTDSRFNKGER